MAILDYYHIWTYNPRFYSLRYGHYAKWHRMAGDIYVIAHVVSLWGSLGFLTKHTFHQGAALQTYPEDIEASISHGGIDSALLTPTPTAL